MRRHLVNGTILGGVLVAFWACSSNPPAKNTTHPDAGHVDAGPSASVNSSGASGSALTGSTSSGTSTSGASSGSASSGSGSSGSSGCSHRSDCANALACINGVCGAEGPDAGCSSNDQCIKAFICEADKCIAGCDSNIDCHGTNLPKCLLGNPGHCGACTANTDCVIAGDPSTDNQVCQNGKCLSPTMCSSPATCGNLGCVNGFCGSCTSNSDCTAGTTHCDPALADGGGTGFCVAGPMGCDNDAQCQALNGGNAGWYCEAGQCELGCPPASACNPPVMGCCDPSLSACSAATHSCVPLSTTGTTASPTTGSTGTTASPTTTTIGSSGTTASPTTGGTSGTTGTTGCSCDSCTAQGGTCDPVDCTCTLPTQDPCCASQDSTTNALCAAGGFICLFACCDPFGCCAGTPAPTDAGPPGACTYNDTVGEPCQDDCKCGTGLICTNGTQTFSPSNSSDENSCLTNWNNGCTTNLTCEPAPVPDAGPPDAGPPDGGPADAGSESDTDAGLHDAG